MADSHQCLQERMRQNLACAAAKRELLLATEARDQAVSEMEDAMNSREAAEARALKAELQAKALARALAASRQREEELEREVARARAEAAKAAEAAQTATRAPDVDPESRGRVDATGAAHAGSPGSVDPKSDTERAGGGERGMLAMRAVGSVCPAAEKAPKLVKEKGIKTPVKYKLKPLPKSAWIPSYQHNRTAQARLFVFYGAGGNAKSVSFWKWHRMVEKRFPEIELVVFEYPGHQSHEGECITDIDAFERAFREDITQGGFQHGLDDFFARPFAILGQSTGARVGTSIVQMLCRNNIRAEKLYVVGRTPPLVSRAGRQEDQEEPFSHALRLRIEQDPEWLRMFHEDSKLNSRPLKPLPRKLQVGRSGYVLWKSQERNIPRLRRRASGSEVRVTFTGEEQRTGVGRWVQVDANSPDVDLAAGEVLVNEAGQSFDVTVAELDSVVTVDEPMLEEPESDEQSVDESSQFLKVPLPIQVHCSSADRLEPLCDPSGCLRPMSEWNRLTSRGAELVEHKGLGHFDLLADVAMFEQVCEDFLRACGLR